MEKEILKYLSKYAPITEEIETAIANSAIFRSFKKGTVLLREGELSNECFFVVKGCVRQYMLKEGEDRTIEFYTEERSVVPSNFGTSTPSDCYFECSEETTVCVGNPELEKETFSKYPQLESISRIIAEKIVLEQQESMAKFKSASPEERYLNLLETRPDLIQRVPLHQVATYLGVQPESLSRIRKRISKNTSTS